MSLRKNFWPLFIVIALSVTTIQAFADTITLTGGSSITLGGTTVSCGGNSAPQQPQCAPQQCMVARQAGIGGPGLQYATVSYTDCSGSSQWVGNSSCPTDYTAVNEQCIQSKLALGRSSGLCY